jgi:hypothetical protein
MRRVVQHGYDKDGEFVIRVREDVPGFAPVEQEISLLRIECNKIAKHMTFGKKGDERVIETVNGVEVK